MSNTNIVIIDRDPATLGEAATAADINSYAANLEEHLGERFPGKTFQVRQELGARAHCPDNGDVDTYVRDLTSGDGWTQFVG